MTTRGEQLKKMNIKQLAEYLDKNFGVQCPIELARWHLKEIEKIGLSNRAELDEEAVADVIRKEDEKGPVRRIAKAIVARFFAPAVAIEWPEKRTEEDDWRNLECKDCRYRVDAQCRRFPPSYFIGCGQDPYPIVETKNHYGSVFNSACAEYKNINNK